MENQLQKHMDNEKESGLVGCGMGVGIGMEGREPYRE